MRNGISREFDVRLRDEDCDRQNLGLTETQISRIAEAEAAYSPNAGWEQAMQLLADHILEGYDARKAARTSALSDRDQD